MNLIEQINLEGPSIQARHNQVKTGTNQTVFLPITKLSLFYLESRRLKQRKKTKQMLCVMSMSIAFYTKFVCAENVTEIKQERSAY